MIMIDHGHDPTALCIPRGRNPDQHVPGALLHRHQLRPEGGDQRAGPQISQRQTDCTVGTRNTTY
jgi:hypothetical protein